VSEQGAGGASEGGARRVTRNRDRDVESGWLTPPGITIRVSGWEWLVDPNANAAHVITEGDIELAGATDDESAVIFEDNIWRYPGGELVGGDEPPWWVVALAWATIVPRIVERLNEGYE
jgi:hypothetical protein